MYSPADAEWARVLHIIPAVLDGNLVEIDRAVLDGLRAGYSTGKFDRPLAEILDEMRTTLTTAGRVLLTDLRGAALTGAELEETLNIESFRLHVRRSVSRGHLDQFRADLRADILRPGSRHRYLIEYLLERLAKVIIEGANQRKNDVNDALIVAHLVDPEVAILTRDGAMQTILSGTFSRPSLTPTEALRALGG
jgi:hypothetical protein